MGNTCVFRPPPCAAPAVPCPSARASAKPHLGSLTDPAFACWALRREHISFTHWIRESLRLQPICFSEAPTQGAERSCPAKAAAPTPLAPAPQRREQSGLIPGCRAPWSLQQLFTQHALRSCLRPHTKTNLSGIFLTS